MDALVTVTPLVFILPIRIVVGIAVADCDCSEGLERCPRLWRGIARQSHLHGLGVQGLGLRIPWFRDSWVMLYECKFLKVTWKNSVVPKVLVPIDSSFEAVVGLCSPLEHPLPHKHILRHTINMVYVVESASESVSRSTP